MKLIFIRHGDPNYEIDGLTEKGQREGKSTNDRAAHPKFIILDIGLLW